MRLVVVSAGRFDSGPERALYDHYAERLRPLARRSGLGPLDLIEVAARGALREQAALANAVPPGLDRVALDPAGDAVTSEAFAAALARARDQGTGGIAFLIGGATGLGALAATATRRLSFGQVTWPHLLVRGLLAEQLYRAATILVGHPYHRGS